jgi:hypothetical protein
MNAFLRHILDFWGTVIFQVYENIQTFLNVLREFFTSQPLVSTLS